MSSLKVDLFKNEHEAIVTVQMTKPEKDRDLGLIARSTFILNTIEYLEKLVEPIELIKLFEFCKLVDWDEEILRATILSKDLDGLSEVINGYKLVDLITANQTKEQLRDLGVTYRETFKEILKLIQVERGIKK